MRFKEAPTNYIIVPNKLWQAVNLSMNAKIIAISLLSKINGKTKLCYPTQSQLSIECEMPIKQVRKALNELALLQVIVVTPVKRTRKSVLHQPNHSYSFNHSNQWLLTYTIVQSTSDPF